MDNENKRDPHCLLTNPLICKITSELVRKLLSTTAGCSKMWILLQSWPTYNQMPGNSKQMSGKGIRFPTHITFTVPLLCVRFVVCQVGGELSYHHGVKWFRKNGQSGNFWLPDSATLTGRLAHWFCKCPSPFGRFLWMQGSVASCSFSTFLSELQATSVLEMTLGVSFCTI